MTHDELAAIVEGLVPVIKAYIKGHENELATLREAVLPRMHAAETRNTELETRCAALEARVLECEARAATVRS